MWHQFFWLFITARPLLVHLDNRPERLADACERGGELIDDGGGDEEDLPLLYRLDLVGAVFAVITERSVNLIEVAAVLTGQMRAGVIVEEVDEQAVV